MPRVAVDRAGDVYVVGTFSGQVAFGPFTLQARGDQDRFLAKLNGSDGSVAWALAFNATTVHDDSFDNMGDIAVDDAGHVAVATGLGGVSEHSQAPHFFDAVLASFDTATGARRWQRILSKGDPKAHRLIAGRDGDFYATVFADWDSDFGGAPILGPPWGISLVLRIVP